MAINKQQLTQEEFNHKREFLEKVYDTANDHLKEQDNKKQQVMAAMIALLSFTMALDLTKKETILGSFDQAAKIALYIVLFFVFVSGNLILFSLKSWHEQYRQVAEIMAKLLMNDEIIKAGNESIDAYIESNLISKKRTRYDYFIKDKNYKKFFKSTEDLTNLVFMFMPFAFSATYFKVIFPNATKTMIIIFIILSITLFIFFFWYYIGKKNNTRTIRTWLTQFGIHSSNNYLAIDQTTPKIVQKTGGVVVLPVYEDGTILMLNINRKIISTDSIELVRGFLEKGEKHKNAALRELKEETGLEGSNPIELGSIHIDSGLINDNVKVYKCQVNDKNIKLQTSEHIKAYKILTLEEINNLIKENKIKDNFTISAISLYENKFH